MFFILAVLGYVGSYLMVKNFFYNKNMKLSTKPIKKKYIFILQVIVAIIIAAIFSYANKGSGIIYGVLSGSILSIISSIIKS